MSLEIPWTWVVWTRALLNGAGGVGITMGEIWLRCVLVDFPDEMIKTDAEGKDSCREIIAWTRLKLGGGQVTS